MVEVVATAEVATIAKACECASRQEFLNLFPSAAPAQSDKAGAAFFYSSPASSLSSTAAKISIGEIGMSAMHKTPSGAIHSGAGSTSA
jgi:hypothetical protein